MLGIWRVREELDTAMVTVPGPPFRNRSSCGANRWDESATQDAKT